jgi:Leucine Rich repeat
MSIAPTVESIEDAAELLYLSRRKRARRRQLVAILSSLSLVLVYLGWKAGSHLIASLWLQANHYKVIWEAHKDNWKQGGSTTVKYVEYWEISQSGRANTDLRILSWLHRVEELDLSKSYGLRDQDLAGLDKLTDLRSLDLDRSRYLSWAWNDQGQLSDATLVPIKALRKLQILNLGGQPITDVGLANLAALNELRDLDLQMTEITDAGLEHLKALKRLKSLDVTGTKVTPKGILDFEASRPGVAVQADPPSPAPRLTTGSKP